MENLHDCGKIQIVVSARELKYKDDDEVIVYKMQDGKKTPTASMLFGDIEFMKSYLSTEQIEVLACANHLVRCQNIARAWDKPKASKVDPAIASALKDKDLSEDELARVVAYLNKI